MVLSRSSWTAADPLSDVLEVLGPRISRLTRLEAANAWALDFPALDRLKFVALLKGRSWLILPKHPPWLMGAGDVCLIGRTPYAVASDPALPRTDGHSLFGVPGRDAVRLGGSDMVSIGGSVSFAEGNAEFLPDMLPDFLPIPQSSPGSGSIATILALLGDEMERAHLGRGVVTARLADVLLVEAIRRPCGGRRGRRDRLAGRLVRSQAWPGAARHSRRHRAPLDRGAARRRRRHVARRLRRALHPPGGPGAAGLCAGLAPDPCPRSPGPARRRCRQHREQGRLHVTERLWPCLPAFVWDLARGPSSCRARPVADG